MRWTLVVSTLAAIAGGCGADDGAGSCETDGCSDSEGSSGPGTTAASVTAGTTTTTTSTTTDATTTGDPTTSDSATSSETSGDAGDWWDCGWSERVTLAVVGPAGDEVLEDFAVGVFVDGAWFDHAAAADDGADLRFVDGEGNELPHEIEAWDPSGTSVVWVGIPSIPAAGQGVRVDLYYGNAGAEDSQAPDLVWTAYARVWHLDGGRTDSVAAAELMGTASEVEGIAGVGASFDGATDALYESPAGVGPDLFATGGTLSAWVYPVGWGASGFGRIVEIASALQGAGGFSWYLAQSVDGMQFHRGHDGTPGYWSFPNAVTLDTWTHVAVTYDDADSTTAPIAYANADPVVATALSTPTGSPESTATEPLTIGQGAFTDAARNFDGIIDELRVRSVASSPRWIAAEKASVEGTLVAALQGQSAPDACP